MPRCYYCVSFPFVSDVLLPSVSGCFEGVSELLSVSELVSVLEEPPEMLLSTDELLSEDVDDSFDESVLLAAPLVFDESELLSDEEFSEALLSVGDSSEETFSSSFAL